MVQGSERQAMLTLRRTKMQIQGQSSLLPQALLTLVQVTKLENVKSTKKTFGDLIGSVRNESESPDSSFLQHLATSISREHAKSSGFAER